MLKCEAQTYQYLINISLQIVCFKFILTMNINNINIQLHQGFMISTRLDQLANYMIRPRRRSYHNTDLGPTFFKSKFGVCNREDFQVQFKYGQTYGYTQQQKVPTSMNDRKKTSSQFLQPESKQSMFMKCSIYFPVGSRKIDINNDTPDERICVLGLHGNTGSRMSTITLLEPVLKYGLVLAIFDFIGCGNSQGDHVTLGYTEKHQIAAVLQQIHNRYSIHKFILYGRSMGAGSSLFYCDQVYPLYAKNKQNKIMEYYEKMSKQKQNRKAVLMDVVNKQNKGYFGYEIVGLIMDSPYYDTKQMILDIVEQRLWFVPRFITNYVLETVNQRAKGKLQYMGHKESRNTGRESDSKTKEKKQNKKPISILHDVKIQKETQIPFPVYLIYGLHDDVIAKNHTIQLFKRLVCERKKLHVLEGKGHGDHRDDQLKMQSLEWVLEFQYERISQRVCRDAQMLGMSVDQYTKHSCSFNYSNFNKNQKQVYNWKKQSMRQKYTQASTEIGSLASIKAAIYPYFGSCTSIQSQDNYRVDLTKKCSQTTKNTHSNLDQIIQHGQSFLINQPIKPIHKLLSFQKLSSPRQKSDQLIQCRQKLINMSRVAPFRQMRMKMGINLTGKSEYSEEISMKSNKSKNH